MTRDTTGLPFETPDVRILREIRSRSSMPRLDELRRAKRLTRRTLPDGSELELVQKFFSAELRAFDAESGEVEVVASDGTVDRMGDVINPNGWDLSSYRKNPVVLSDHEYSIHGIVGRALSTKKIDGRLVQRQLLDSSETNTEAAKVRSLIGNKMLRTVSVGFRALDWEWMKDDDGESDGGIHFKKQELLEVSWVAVPANPNAVLAEYEAPAVPPAHAVDKAAMLQQIDRAARIALLAARKV